MKILTLNTHSLMEPEYRKKTLDFIEMIQKEQPEVFALQEVNQSLAAQPAGEPESSGFVPCEGFQERIKADNHALLLARLLKERGLPYSWTWTPAKLGYEIYEEGLAVFCRLPITRTFQAYISHTHEYTNWKTRKFLGVQMEGRENCWFGTVHMGWWDDPEEPFREQWKRLSEELQRLREEGLQDTGAEPQIWLMGDFNSPAQVRQEGYDLISGDGWKDTYVLAEKKDAGITVGKVIDGWRDKMDPADGERQGMRIDVIWCSGGAVRSSQVVFNGENYPVVSDHYGIMIETVQDGVKSAPQKGERI